LTPKPHKAESNHFAHSSNIKATKKHPTNSTPPTENEFLPSEPSKIIIKKSTLNKSLHLSLMTNNLNKLPSSKKKPQTPLPASPIKSSGALPPKENSTPIASPSMHSSAPHNSPPISLPTTTTTFKANLLKSANPMLIFPKPPKPQFKPKNWFLRLARKDN
jgi:hypothetical protein